jgi:hypothetical protein
MANLLRGQQDCGCPLLGQPAVERPSFALSPTYIGRDQYTILVTVVVLSALVPTLIAQQFFRPRLEDHLEGTRRSRAGSGARPGRRAGVAVNGIYRPKGWRPA